MTSKVSDAAIEAGRKAAGAWGPQSETRSIYEAIYLAMKAQEAADLRSQSRPIVEGGES